MSRVLVSMPTYKTPDDLLRRAVQSVLRQTHTDLRLVVVADGVKIRELPRDDRLIVHRLPENRGRYFCDAVVTALAADDEVVVIHDADDWSDPDRIERLLPVLEDGAAIARYHRHMPRGGHHIQEPSKTRFGNPDGNFVHIGHWCSGAYTGERIRRAGGIHPGFRVGYDTLFVRMLAYTGPVGISRRPSYHWERRKGGSLTTSPETKFGSPHRLAARKELVRLNTLAWEARQRGEDPGQVIRDDIPDDLAEQVEIAAAELAEKL